MPKFEVSCAPLRAVAPDIADHVQCVKQGHDVAVIPTPNGDYEIHCRTCMRVLGTGPTIAAAVGTAISFSRNQEMVSAMADQQEIVGAMAEAVSVKVACARCNQLARLLLEARDALPAISLASARLRGIDLSLADRIEAALEPWRDKAAEARQ